MDGGQVVDNEWLRVSKLEGLKFFNIFLLLSCQSLLFSISFSVCRFRFWHQSVQSSLFFSQCHEGPQHRLRCRRGSRGCAGMKTHTAKHRKKTKKHAHSCKLQPHAAHTSCSVFVCTLTNPLFYLCLTLSAVGRHPFQGQLFLPPHTCVLCVVFSSAPSRRRISACFLPLPGVTLCSV